MPVKTLHREYEEYHPDWTKCRDAYNGQRAIKKAGTTYLPRLSEQSDAEYAAYKDRALFYSITSKSVAALVGMATARPPIIKYPEKMQSYFVENSGTQFYEVLGTTIGEILLMGRYGLLVDRQVGGGPPQIHGYRSESILNWKTNRDGKAFLVVLQENMLDPNDNDEFTAVGRVQYRVLRLQPRNTIMQNPSLSLGLLSDMALLPLVNEAGSDWIYTVSIYDANEEHVSTVVPSNTGRPMNVIPFYVGNPFGINFNVAKSPMLDIADVNISHYRTSADLEHGRHFTGLPTAWVAGVDPSTKLKIGGETAWILPSEGKAGFLEFTGQGLGSLENAMKEKQSQMASLASRVMDNSGNGSEASDAIRLRYMSESASLSSITRSAEAMVNLAYKTIAAMESLDPNEVNIVLEKEFHNVRLSPTEMLKMTESYLTGGMSVETYVFNMRRGDLLDPSHSDEEEIARLEAAKKALEVANAAKAASATPPKNQPPAQ